MVEFIASLLITALMIAAAYWVGKRRDPAQPLTWGEAFAAGTFVLALMLMFYGVVPDRWLRLADGQLKWRSDKIGVPTGPLPFKHHLLWEHGVTFWGRGRILVTAQVIRDLIATVIYGVFMGINFMGWSWWQKRGRKAAETPAIETSAYGRPLIRRV